MLFIMVCVAGMKRVRSPRVSGAGQHSSGGGAAAEADVESPAASKAKRTSGLSSGGTAADKGLEAAAVKESDSPRAKQRKRRQLCCILTLLLALVAAGIGVGVWQGIEKSKPRSAVQQQQQQSGAPLTFRVTVGAPIAEQSAVACAKWFGDKQVSSSWVIIDIDPHHNTPYKQGSAYATHAAVNQLQHMYRLIYTGAMCIGNNDYELQQAHSMSILCCVPAR
jgi:hypothetical protein